jgi:hypothetical protein
MCHNRFDLLVVSLLYIEKSRYPAALTALPAKAGKAANPSPSGLVVNNHTFMFLNDDIFVSPAPSRSLPSFQSHAI